MAEIENLVHRWSEGERLAEESLAVLLELIVERGDPVPRIMRDFALLRIRGETRGKLRKSPWANAERDDEICCRIEELRRQNRGLALYHTKNRKGDGTSVVEIVAKERGMEPGAVEKIWLNASKPLTEK